MSSQFTSYYLQEIWSRVQAEQWELNFYDFLRKLVSGGFRTEDERNGALSLIDRLQSAGVFGTSVDNIEVKSKEEE